uniref:SSD domain-containing protein n=1 Tax=Candidatus Kentrum sp. UNK TaxID=2126344 RepID=A0A451ALK1_9GAMM|nr:MAG: hypothetical protein BECKUNK1418G_GA0071005_11159 [Candidatus Kentron sp. UNK]VFK72348.1 MAG: hypothetical protein BECKUNK1418H_GA0071006_11099 [Candidatus Kentron sp. UNK]
MVNPERMFSEWVARYRWWWLACMPLMTLALAWGIDLKFSGNYRVFFSEDNPQLQAFDNLERTYTQDNNVIFLLIPREGNVFTRETLAAVEQLTEMAWQLPYSLRVDSLTNFQHTEAKGDNIIIRDLAQNVVGLDDARIARIRKIALTEPLLLGKLIPKDGAATIVNVDIQLPNLDEARETTEVATAARGIADEIRGRYPHLGVHLSGMVIMNGAFTEAALGDMEFLIRVSFGIMVVVLVLFLGIWGAFATLLIMVMSVLAGMGMGGYLGFPLTPPSASAPLIIMTMAIANSVHVLAVFYQELCAGADAKHRLAAMRESLRVNLQPLFLTTFTTIIGFLTLNFSEVPPFRDLGNFVSAGVGASFVFSVTFLPAMMILLPTRARRLRFQMHMMTRLGGFVVRHRRWLLWSTTGLVVILLSFIPRNELNDVFVRYLDETYAFRRDTDLLDKHLGGLYHIDYSLDSGEANGINDPKFLRKIDAFADWLRRQPEVTHVKIITDTFKRLNKTMHGDAPDQYRLPERGDLAAQYLLLYEMSLPYGLDLNNTIDVDKSATRISVSTEVLSSRQVIALERRARQWLVDNAPMLAETEGSSPTMMFSYIGERNIRAMLGATTLALVLISLVLILALRSLKIGLISMLPNLIPAGMAFGLWGVLVGEIGLALSVVTSMTLGVVVDDTVHFLSKYLRARREQGMSSEDAIRHAFSHVGMALVITSVVLIAGFLVLSLSDFYPNSGMGLMTAMILALALVADFLFLPPLLMKIEGPTRIKSGGINARGSAMINRQLKTTISS